MPIYEYRCDDCGADFEELVRGEGALATAVKCSACGSSRIERLISGFAVSGGEAPGSRPAPLRQPGGRGPCGPACGCH
jgi:putative FmdB family regulatory protein